MEKEETIVVEPGEKPPERPRGILLYLQEFESMDHFKRELITYLDYYNNRRIQVKTKWMPPSKFREASMMIS